jgi:hypothetical protein
MSLVKREFQKSYEEHFELLNPFGCSSQIYLLNATNAPEPVCYLQMAGSHHSRFARFYLCFNMVIYCSLDSTFFLVVDKSLVMKSAFCRGAHVGNLTKRFLNNTEIVTFPMAGT